MAHPWFQVLDWDEIKNKTARAPYVPPLDNFGLDNFDEMFIKEDIDKDQEEMNNFNTSFDNFNTGKLDVDCFIDFTYENSQSSGTEMEDWKF